MEVVTVEVPEEGGQALLSLVEDLETRYDVVAQAVDARYIAGHGHLQTAWRMVERAAERDRMIADEQGMEWLLYLTGTRQIDRALTAGVQADTPVAAVIMAGDRAEEAAAEVRDRTSPVDTDLGDEEVLREWFEVTPREEGATTAALEELVCERVVLLQLEA